MKNHILFKALVAFLLLGVLDYGVWAIESECSACEAVANELQRRLDAEYKREHLDMRHRLDKDGNRYGKILNYRVSEQRAVNLLDELCSEMDYYTLITAAEDSSSTGGSSSNDTAAAADSSSSSSSKKNSKKKKKRSKSGGQLEWVKYKGEGSAKVPRDKRPGQAEEEQRAKQLKTFCGMILEDFEDELIAALRTDQFSAEGVSRVLCHHITHKCKGKQYALPDHASSSTGDKEL